MISRNKLSPLVILCAITAIITLSSCTANFPKNSAEDSSQTSSVLESKSDSKTAEPKNAREHSDKANAFLAENFPSNGEATILNFRGVQEGEEIAVLKTNMGEIKLMFFPEVAPKAVENFKGLATSGYYDNLTFHRVIDDFMIQGGDPTGTGTGGESFFNENFEDEFSEQALNVRGALCMANAGPNTNGSQFFIVEASKDSIGSDVWDMLEQKSDEIFPESVMKVYEEHGGTPWLDFKHTVFGQVYDGMDIVDAIAKVEADVNAKPKKDVIIESITFEPATAATAATAAADTTSSKAASESKKSG